MLAMSPFLFSKFRASAVCYTLSLHDALPISHGADRLLDPGAGRRARAHLRGHIHEQGRGGDARPRGDTARRDRKSTRLNSSHPSISYAVFCLKKKTSEPV